MPKPSRLPPLVARKWAGAAGPGYVYGNACGHWDVGHKIIDALPTYPEHTLHQLLNDIKNQETTGRLPGPIYMPGGRAQHDSVYWNHNTQGHPPLWPVAALVTGTATPEQANCYINNYLVNPPVFLTEHPIATVGRRDPKFELHPWRGPAWNSMAYRAARACLNYGRRNAARLILEKALNDSAAQFRRTGTIREFYHPLSGHPETVQRKPSSKYNVPGRDYLGHNPLLAMARLYDSLK